MSESIAPTPYEADELAAIRDELPAVVAQRYLNAGWMGPIPRRAHLALLARQEQEFARRVTSTWFDDLLAAQEAARVLLGQLTGVGTARVALMHATHDAINTCVWGMDLAPGDSIVTTDEEHPGLLTPLRMVRDRLGVEIRTVPFGRGDSALAQRLADACDGSTMAVVASHVSWVTGHVLDLAALGESLPSRVKTVIDGAQGAGIVDLELDAWGTDAYTVSGQKWTLGPNGTGGLIVSDPEWLRPTWCSWMTTRNPSECMTAPLRKGAARLEFAQENLPLLESWGSSLEFLLEDVGVSRAASHACRMNGYLRELLARRGGPAADMAADAVGDRHLVVLPLADDVDAARLVRALEAESDVLVRDLPGAPRLRLSLGPWVTSGDVEGFVDAVAVQLGWD